MVLDVRSCRKQSRYKSHGGSLKAQSRSAKVTLAVLCVPKFMLQAGVLVKNLRALAKPTPQAGGYTEISIAIYGSHPEKEAAERVMSLLFRKDCLLGSIRQF